MKVGLADLPKQYHAIQAEVDTAVHDVLESGVFLLGPQVAALEEEVAALCGARFGVGVNSGTDALLLSLVAHGVGPGDEVITSPFTFVATVETIAQVGATPVFADVDPRTFNLCPDAVAQKITPRTRAIIPVDLFGQMADRDKFTSLAERHNLLLIWDAAQAIGATFNAKPLGAFPGTVTLSFFPTKNLGACGDGGMILTNDEEMRDKLRQFRFHGSGGGYFYAKVGYCSRLDALQAAILRAKLTHLPDWNEMRRRHASRYRDILANAAVELPYCDPRAGHIYHQFTIRHPRRDALKAYLKTNEVDSGIYYPLALHLQEAYASLGYHKGDMPEAERASEEVLSIPVYPEMTDQQLEHVANLIRRFEQ